MIYEPGIGAMLKKADCNYTLVSVTAKRARQLIDGAPQLVDMDPNKPVTVAVNELFEDKIVYRRIASSEAEITQAG